jgi:hypothetical protein
MRAEHQVCGLQRDARIVHVCEYSIRLFADRLVSLPPSSLPPHTPFLPLPICLSLCLTALPPLTLLRHLIMTVAYTYSYTAGAYKGFDTQGGTIVKIKSTNLEPYRLRQITNCTPGYKVEDNATCYEKHGTVVLEGGRKGASEREKEGGKGREGGREGGREERWRERERKRGESMSERACTNVRPLGVAVLLHASTLTLEGQMSTLHAGANADTNTQGQSLTRRGKCRQDVQEMQRWEMEGRIAVGP